jgi:hypothetical protein
MKEQFRPSIPIFLLFHCFISGFVSDFELRISDFYPAIPIGPKSNIQLFNFWLRSKTINRHEEVSMITFPSKQTHTLTMFVSLLLGLILAFWPKPSFSQTVASQEQAGSVLAIEKLTVQDGTVTGEIRNKSKNTVRDVQLFIRYTWLWKDEFHPGKDNPSAAFYPTMAGEITPGGSMPFKFTPAPPLPKRSDGRFEAPSVSIAGFTQIIPQSK